MKKLRFLCIACMFITLLYSCSKKTVPEKETTAVAPPPKLVIKKIKTPVPSVIVVNDAKASKTFDGKMYYDLEGHRYWRNNRDGKYYKYSKAMQNNPDFKAP